MDYFPKAALTFDDVLLKPRYSEVVPSKTDISTELCNIKFRTPVLSAAMDTVTEQSMALEMANYGGMGIIHKNLPIKIQADMVKFVKEFNKLQRRATIDRKNRMVVGAAVGVTDDDRCDALEEAGVDFFCVDTAHGHSSGVYNAVKRYKATFNVPIIAGNVATKEGVKHLMEAGADAIKVGIGPGSICTTRIISGVGIPQLSAIMECASISNVPIIADGGIRNSGDIVKALAAGADMVMLGSLLAGTEEAPGETFIRGGNNYKKYRGMGSKEAMKKGSAGRYLQDSKSDKLIPEGVSAIVPYKGFVEDVLDKLIGGLRSGMGYLGANNINELQYRAQFIRITPASVIESRPHDLITYKED